MNYQKAIEWVHSLPRFSKSRLASIKALLNKLGNPQQGLKFVHIAGTNGKGSTAVMLACVLKEAGYKTGANISPYVLDFRERFQINGEMIEQDALAEILTEVKAAVEQLDGVCEFETVTAAALLWFAREKCEIVCLEVGIGGRLDATNAIENTLVACIMHIARDHTELLGDTLDKIAAEKCAIFKNRCDVVCYPVQEPQAMAAIEQAAAQGSCLLTTPQVEDFYFYKCKSFENRINYGGYDLCVPFAGQHQAFNASVVVEAAIRLCEHGFDISDDCIINGIAKAKIPARIQVLARSPLVLLDGAHNLDGVMALVQTIKNAGCKKMAAVVGVLKDKEPQLMLQALAECFDTLYTVTPQSPRALSAADLAHMAQLMFDDVVACDSLQSAIAKAKLHENGFCVCGSLYLACEAYKILK